MLSDYTGPQYNETLFLINFICLCYGCMFCVMLIGFSCYTNSLVLQNITSNENLRKRWNARHKTTNEASWCQKLKYYYFEQTTESKIQKYYDIMGSTLLDTGEPQRITRMKAQGSVMAVQDGELFE